MKSNIILTGMPGAGKSTVGVVLAKTIGYDFTDVDILIAKRQGMPLQEILDGRGIDYFLSAEQEEGQLLDVCKTVVATGGSMVLNPSAMAHLKEGGICIYLQVPLEALEERLTNMKTRGIAAAPGATLEDIYLQRAPLYRKYSDIIIDCQKKNTEEVVTAIVEALQR